MVMELGLLGHGFARVSVANISGRQRAQKLLNRLKLLIRALRPRNRRRPRILRALHTLILQLLYFSLLLSQLLKKGKRHLLHLLLRRPLLLINVPFSLVVAHAFLHEMTLKVATAGRSHVQHGIKVFVMLLAVGSLPGNVTIASSNLGFDR